MKHTFLFATIASILSINAFADPATITTQDYVDNKFQEKIPAGSFGANNSVVTYDSTTGDVQERLIIHPTSDSWWDETRIKAYTATGSLMDNGIKTFALWALNATDEQYENALLPAKYIDFGFKNKQAVITPGTTGSVAIFNGTAGGNGSANFTERAIYDGSTTYDSTTDTDKLVTAGVVDSKQDKMTCARYIENAEQTSANCLLWNIPD